MISKQEVFGMTNASKRPYAQPGLNRLGGVANLTASGSGIKAEVQQPANCSQDGNRFPCGNP